VEGRELTSFASRGRARRRASFLRKARELAYRDLGGLVFNLHRFGQRNDELVLAKLQTLEQIDGELRALEAALGAHEPLTVLREAGITACPRCAAIHSSEDRFCPGCGLSLGPHAEHPAELRASAPAPATRAPAPEATQPPLDEGSASEAGEPPEQLASAPGEQSEATVIMRPSASGQ
jgi:transposase